MSVIRAATLCGFIVLSVYCICQILLPNAVSNTTPSATIERLLPHDTPGRRELLAKAASNQRAYEKLLQASTDADRSTILRQAAAAQTRHTPEELLALLSVDSDQDAVTAHGVALIDCCGTNATYYNLNGRLVLSINDASNSGWRFTYSNSDHK